jgi:hypothetical protein
LLGAKVQAWHGSDLNGVSARLLMENSDKFFGYMENDLIAVWHDDSDFTNQDITEMMQHYKLMYTELGSCYSYLCQILPLDDDLINLKNSIENARKLWMEKLKISCTPKAHNLFDGHAYEQHKRLGGIGDKLEDFVEKCHQFGIHDEHHTWNIQELGNDAMLANSTQSSQKSS